MKRFILYLLFSLIFVLSCTREETHEKDSIPQDPLLSGWEVPLEQLVLTSNGLDRIPSIDTPQFVRFNNALLLDNEIAFVYRFGDTVKVYPKRLIDIHEIINDRIGNHFFAISYCPLTGSALAWNREIDGEVSEFGVSGHLFNENLIPYDRNSSSYWSQMQLEGIKGQHSGAVLRSESLLITTGKTIHQSFPDSYVLLDDIGHVCDSICTGKENNKLMNTTTNSFGIIDKRIAHADEVLLFEPSLFSDSISILQTDYSGSKMLIIASKSWQFVTAFINDSPSETQFFPVQNKLPIAFADSNGNSYDLTGMIISGPDLAKRLLSPMSYSARSFAWDLFYKDQIERFKK